jgi:hypothetical protein
VKLLKRLASEWDEFWFQEDNEVNLAAFQTVFALGIFIIYFFRFLDYSMIFGETGILPFNILRKLIPTEYQGGLPLEYLAKNETVGWSLHLIFITCLAAQFFGLQNRVFQIFIFLLHLVFLKRNPFAIYGTDMVATCWFLYLCFVKTPVRFRFQFLKKSKTSSELSIILNSVGLRLIQIQLCIIYAYSGLEKARGNTWWNGDAIWFALGNSQVASMDFGFLVHTQWLIALMTFSTIVWEVYFPFAIWIPRIRKYMLVIGCFFHLGIAMMMNLYDFSFMMLAVYILFIEEETLTQFLRRWKLLS